MSAAPAMQQPGSHPGSASGTPGPVGTPQPLQQPMSNPSMLMQQQQQVQQQQQQQQQQMQQQQQLPRPPPLDPSKEKLVTAIHEYLLLHGAPKAAETLKIEMGPCFPNAKWATTNSCEPPGFLSNWWSLFYDLYCAAPERRNEPDMMSTQEAKMFHDYNYVQGGFNPPMMNGLHPQFAAPGMMGPEGMMQAFPGRFPGRGGGPPVGHPMQQFMAYDPRLGGRPPQPPMGAAMQPGGGRPPQMTPGSFPVAAMRPPHMTPGGGGQMPPQGMYRGPPFMEGGGPPPPGAFPGGPPHGMGGMNGAVMGMGSPGMQPMQGHPGGPPAFMMMPTSSGPMPQFGMGVPGVSGEGGMTGPPSHPSQQSAHTPLANNGPSSAGMPGATGNPLSAGNAGMGGGMMNGEMKNSPNTPRGNGGTPGGGHGGPGSGAPGSVHSGGAGSVPPPGGDGITPKQEPMDTSQAEGDDCSKEVEKIKASLISDFPTKEETESFGY